MRKRYRTALLAISCISVLSCSNFGSSPEGDLLKRLETSPHYSVKLERFVNRRDAAYERAKKDIQFTKLLKAQVLGTQVRTPQQKLPEVAPDFSAFLEHSDAIKYIWFGHSTFLVNIAGKIVLFDPVFSSAASPVSLFVRRFQAPVALLEDLPEVDYIVISHDHYDHLDMESIKFFRDKETRFLTPLGVSSHLLGWGIPAERIDELDWWDEFSDGQWTFVCTPSQHFSGRKGFLDQNKTLWSSWVVQSKSQKMFFSGDSGYDVHFQQIGKRYGPFDITFMENGQYNEQWPMSHMFPEEAAQAHRELGGKAMQAVHWGMFNLSLHDWYEPIERALAAAQDYENTLLTPVLGELVDVSQNASQTLWWREYIPAQ